ncbi:MAG: THUMP domain-containing protein [Flavobacteriales bacterium]
MTAQTVHGLERVLATELEAIGATGIEVGVRAVRFTGDKACMYRANLCLRTALRVLVPLERSGVRNEDDIYHAVKRVHWEDFMSATGTLSVQCTLRSDFFHHNKYLAQLTKDAVADRFRERTGKRPSVDVEDPDVHIHLLVLGDMCTVSLDSSGAPLYKRGYRDETNLAPINEVLAAGLVLLSGWDGKRNLVDPMCGSGTILIEAAMIAGNIPPGSHRARFGFQGWNDFDADLWESVCDEALNNARADKPLILGGDASANVLRKTATNVASAHVKERVQLKHSAFADLEAPEGGGVLIMNPPYGERMDQDEDINGLYKMIGDTLKKKWAGFEAWVITSNMEAAEHIRLTAKPRIKLFNGSLECRFMRYELYAGSRRREEQPG